MSAIHIKNLLTFDIYGNVEPISIEQILDKDVLELYTRDYSQDKSKYKQECGVIYYLGDPNSPVRQNGLTEKEALAEAIENFNLPKDYVPDALVARLISRYNINAITPAGVAIENIKRALHRISHASIKISEAIDKLIEGAIEPTDIATFVDLSNKVGKLSTELPNYVSSLKVAQDNLRNETEELEARGGETIQYSMDATKHNKLQ